MEGSLLASIGRDLKHGGRVLSVRLIPIAELLAHFFLALVLLLFAHFEHFDDRRFLVGKGLEFELAFHVVLHHVQVVLHFSNVHIP